LFVADVEEGEGSGGDKDLFDLQLELARNLLQQEFDDTLQTEKVHCTCVLVLLTHKFTSIYLSGR
jgi:hypothetical protein